MTKPNLSRRDFLQDAAIGSAALSAVSLAVAGETPQPKQGLTQLTEHLFVHHGPINVGIVRDGDRAILIDCGDGGVVRSLRKLGITKVEQILFTHHHRDQACAAGRFATSGAKIVVPAAERDYFDAVDDYWQDPKSRWHLYNLHPHHLMLAEPVAVDEALEPDDKKSWGPAEIQVVATPGHTDGSISYSVKVDGRHVVFCGDVIYDEGRLWDVHSLQKGFERDGRRVTDYHGFLGAMPELVESLDRIDALGADSLVPSHGHLMNDPTAAIGLLNERLEQCYDKYVAISALRHYFPMFFTEFADRKDHMPIRPGKTPPECLRHFGTTWMLVSDSKAAFVMDCGSTRAIDQIDQRLASGEITSVEGLWVTHYHDDHVDAIPDFQAKFDCPCYADAHVAEVITDPLSWRLPCISPSVAKVDQVTTDGQSWKWREFTMTAFHLPGQTLYHGGLLIEKGDLRMSFIGDSFNMGGIDDYCSSNRNWLGRGVGYDHCVALIEKLRPTHLFNPHVAEAFDFTPGQCRAMRENLAEREGLFGELVPWDHANQGMDEPWVRCFPYEQQAAPGAEMTVDLIVTNHADQPREAACRAVFPQAWNGTATRPMTPNAVQEGWTRSTVPGKSDGRLSLTFRVPPDTSVGRYVVAVDLYFGGRALPRFTEAIVEVRG